MRKEKGLSLIIFYLYSEVNIPLKRELFRDKQEKCLNTASLKRYIAKSRHLWVSDLFDIYIGWRNYGHNVVNCTFYDVKQG